MEISEAEITMIVEACLENVRYLVGVESRKHGLDSMEIYTAIEKRLRRNILANEIGEDYT